MNVFYAESKCNPGFNSDVVRLRLGGGINDREVIFSFNSDVVRLRRLFLSLASSYLSLFQFRCGSIKTMSANGNLLSCSLFQFRCGSIKTLEAEVDQDILSCFNSDVVRLRLKSSSSSFCIAPFQFRCVSIKTTLTKFGLRHTTKFQFRCGSIKTFSPGSSCLT
ncbi:MAG: hypothetical protein LCH67_03620 [Bacteroidetes bacterium]|nr:hypothetical protein [Bacteroidota bacterium]